MPSKFSSNETISDAETIAKNLDLEFHTLPIENIFQNYPSLFSFNICFVSNTQSQGLIYHKFCTLLRYTKLKMGKKNLYQIII